MLLLCSSAAAACVSHLRLQGIYAVSSKALLGSAGVCTLDASRALRIADGSMQSAVREPHPLHTNAARRDWPSMPSESDLKAAICAAAQQATAKDNLKRSLSKADGLADLGPTLVEYAIRVAGLAPGLKIASESDIDGGGLQRQRSTTSRAGVEYSGAHRTCLQPIQSRLSCARCWVGLVRRTPCLLRSAHPDPTR